MACLPSFHVRIAGTGIALVLLMVYSPFACAAGQNGGCSGFAHNFGRFYAMLTVLTVTPFSLMVCFPPFMRGLTGAAIAPVLLMVCLPLFACGPPGQPFLRFLLVVRSPFCARLAGTGIALVPLMVWSSFCVQLTGTAIALVSLTFHAQLAGTAVPPILLMVLAPFMRG